MSKHTRKIFSYGSLSPSVFFRSIFIFFCFVVCFFGSIKIIIYAQEADIITEVVIQTPEISAENSPENSGIPYAPVTDISQNDGAENGTEKVSEIIPESIPVTSLQSERESVDVPELVTGDDATIPNVTIDIIADGYPESIIEQVLDDILAEAEKDAEENPEKDPNDNTDEDPSVDLQDPLLETEIPAPEAEPFIIVTSSEEVMIEASESSSSLLSLLDDVVLDSPLLVTRILEEEIIMDTQAKHSCRLEKFRANVSDVSAMKMRVRFLAVTAGTYEAKIGSLPTGIDVVFAQNQDYTYTVKTKDLTLDLQVINQVGSFDGDFSIPIIYTKEGEKDSSVICQMNVLNESDS